MRRIEDYARSLDRATTDSVRSASALKVAARSNSLSRLFDDVPLAQSRAASIKQYVLDNLKSLLLQLETNCTANGVTVHWATNAESARAIILKLCQDSAPEGSTIVKAKSMATEEIHLNDYLTEHGYKPVETDLGEYVVQLDGDAPSHIVTPIIHKTREQVSETFAREGLGPQTAVAEELAMQARERLRSYFQSSPVGISGVNFAIAESGRLVLVENEGNNRFSTTAPKTHIALMGIEKILPTEADLALFLPLLSGSATGQALTSYVHLISGPAPDGPSQVHLILLDNGRSRVLAGQYREILRCIRCGACLNVCPVYRQASGHAYGNVYSGPLGAVLGPALEGVEKLGDLAKASSLCGACEEVCPVKIPIPRLLLELRDEAERKGVLDDQPPWTKFRIGASSPLLWRAGLKLLPLAERMPNRLAGAWSQGRDLPQREDRSFRNWWHER